MGALTTALVELHDAIAERVHQSPTLRLMVGARVMLALTRVRTVYEQGKEADADVEAKHH